MSLISVTIGSASTMSPSTISSIFPGLAVALGGGVTLFALNWLRDYLTTKWKRGDEAATLAFALVSQLDRLVTDCSDVVHDPLYIDPKDESVTSTVSHPIFGVPESWKWEVFPRVLQYRIRAIPNKIELANRAITMAADFGDGAPEYADAHQETKYQFATIGLEATEIILQLSRLYQVPILDRGAWNPADDFRTVLTRIASQRKTPEQQFTPP